MRGLYSEERKDIKTVFNQFHQNYEINKNSFDSQKKEQINIFLNSLLRQILYLYEQIFNYWKAEIKTNENSNYDIKKIELMIDKVKNKKIFMEFSTEVYLEYISDVTYFLYYIRNNRWRVYSNVRWESKTPVPFCRDTVGCWIVLTVCC